MLPNYKLILMGITSSHVGIVEWDENHIMCIICGWGEINIVTQVPHFDDGMIIYTDIGYVYCILCSCHKCKSSNKQFSYNILWIIIRILYLLVIVYIMVI